MKLPFRKTKTAGWASGSGPSNVELEGVARLNQEISSKFQHATAKLRLLFPREGGGISGRILTFAEVVSEMSSSYPGRVITAAVALGLAWLLLGGLH